MQQWWCGRLLAVVMQQHNQFGCSYTESKAGEQTAKHACGRVFLWLSQKTETESQPFGKMRRPHHPGLGHTIAILRVSHVAADRV